MEDNVAITGGNGAQRNSRPCAWHGSDSHVSAIPQLQTAPKPEDPALYEKRSLDIQFMIAPWLGLVGQTTHSDPGIIRSCFWQQYPGNQGWTAQTSAKTKPPVWPVIDVTYKSIEEIAQEVITVLTLQDLKSNKEDKEKPQKK